MPYFLLNVVLSYLQETDNLNFAGDFIYFQGSFPGAQCIDFYFYFLFLNALYLYIKNVFGW